MASLPSAQHVGPPLDTPSHPLARLAFFGSMIAGLAYAALSVMSDTGQVGETIATGTLVFLALALLIALGFEFVNGFHDTANAVATVIYTNSLPAPVAVVWSGVFNFLGVMLSTGAVAYGIVALLPVELILNVGSGAGYAMIFALLLSAILWNLATWYIGLPNSSSHALIGSILGVGFANQLIGGNASAGVDWSQAQKVFTGLLIAPIIGFVGAFILLKLFQLLLKNPKLYKSPEGDAPPPTGIRALLIATCTAVSFAHGSNDGQKGMGLIMLILIGCAPTAYALNRAMPANDTSAFVTSLQTSSTTFSRLSGTGPMAVADAERIMAQALRTKKVGDPATLAALGALSGEVAAKVAQHKALADIPATETAALRSDMYMVHDGTKLLMKAPPAALNDADKAAIGAMSTGLETATRYIPLWVKLAVALALGLGTMVGWKRIVITVGEKIGKTEMTYGMGSAAEMMAASTILLADKFGLPVSTTHILSSGVAGASVASGAALQGRTIRNMALAWVMTLPAVIALAGGLYWLFLTVFVGR